jgi:hypothetical protein
MIGPYILFAILFIAFLIFIAYSALLIYHWFKFAMNTRAALMASIIYMSSGFILIFVMLVTASSLLPQ